jgi:hypothetical protein
MNKEPRYHLMKSGVVDRWEKKMIEYYDMKLNHECSWALPERFISTNDRMSDETIKTVPAKSGTRMLGCIKEK